MHKFNPRVRRLASCSIVALAAAGALASGPTSAWAADPASAPNTGGEGVEVTSVIVTAERSKAAATAPTKASLDQTQPEAIISRKFIEQVTPENGGWVSSAAIAPSISGITSNGGGVGETTQITMRGFQDGQFNITYDGIAFGDTNGPTHHQASYWPASTIGSVIIDRGPGAAGDLGPANFGGALHYFSASPSDTFGLSQKVLVGSFSTYETVTNLNTGELKNLDDAKVMASFDQRWSAGELSWSGGTATNGLIKVVAPLGPHWDMTLFSSVNYTRFYQNDGTGPGATWAQTEEWGKNFALNNDPGSEHYYKYNYQAKATDFEYADFKGDLGSGMTLEDQYYTYFYANKTSSTNSSLDTGTSNASSLISGATLLPGEEKTDLGGYDKLNQYRVNGDVVRFNKDWSFGTLKVGGLYEWSTTDRHNILKDITDGWAPDDKFTTAKYPLLPETTDQKTMENSAWQDYQLFADFYWRPIAGLTITPGFKYVSEHLEVSAADENTAGGSKNQPLVDSATYSSPLYFLTANYKFTPYWSVYAQFATSFLYPDISSLYYTGASAGLQSLQPEQTKTYQAGTVYSRGQFTADADVYRVDASNLLQACGIGVNAAECNVGKAQFTGVEGEAAYALDFGLTLFVNGSSNVAKQLANAANAAAGIAANPAEELANAPRWTYAFGGLYNHGPWQASLTYKNSGAYVVYGGATTARLPGYDTIDASGAYDFGRFKIKLQAFNLADKRAITTYNPADGTSYLYDRNPADQSVYTFQAGREVDLTLQAKF